MARCSCQSACACVLQGSTTDCIETTVSGTGSVANPYVITSEFICETPESLNPSVRAFHSVDQSIPHDTVTALSFNSERFDNDTMHDLVVNNGRITFTTAGVYQVSFNGALAAASDYNYIDIRIGIVGGSDIARHSFGDLDTSSPPIAFSISTLYKFTAGQQIAVSAYQLNAASAARNMIAAGNYSPEFSAVWVSAG